MLDEAIGHASEAQPLAVQSCEAQLAITRAELEGALSQRQRLMAVVAHELRNLVQGLSYVAQLWEKQPDNKRALLFAQTQIREMGELLQLLLEHSTLVRNALYAETKSAFAPASPDRMKCTFTVWLESMGTPVSVAGSNSPICSRLDGGPLQRLVAGGVSHHDFVRLAVRIDHEVA